MSWNWFRREDICRWKELITKYQPMRYGTLYTHFMVTHAYKTQVCFWGILWLHARFKPCFYNIFTSLSSKPMLLEHSVRYIITVRTTNRTESISTLTSEGRAGIYIYHHTDTFHTSAICGKYQETAERNVDTFHHIIYFVFIHILILTWISTI